MMFAAAFQIPQLQVVVPILLIILAVVFYAATSVKLLHPRERGVIFRLGRPRNSLALPGLVFLIPFIDTLVRVDMEEKTSDILLDEAVTRDGAIVRARATLRYRVRDPQKAIVEVADHEDATRQIGQTVLQQILLGRDLAEIRGEDAGEELRSHTDEATNSFGVTVVSARIGEVEVPRRPDEPSP
jgi:regulator of protease activity HflC (stomatin/prohibitin superfamily)